MRLKCYLLLSVLELRVKKNVEWETDSVSFYDNEELVLGKYSMLNIFFAFVETYFIKSVTFRYVEKAVESTYLKYIAYRACKHNRTVVVESNMINKLRHMDKLS